MLPESYRLALGQQDGLMMAIFARDKAVALIYADPGDDPQPLESFHRDQFRALCTAASQAMERMLGQA
jgi:hypothetical protein